jgi:hypothetical protein
MLAVQTASVVMAEQAMGWPPQMPLVQAQPRTYLQPTSVLVLAQVTAPPEQIRETPSHVQPVIRLHSPWSK